MRPELAKCLLDALGACRAICEFTDGQTFDQYKQDLLFVVCRDATLGSRRIALSDEVNEGNSVPR
jgi:hypothetical protein